MRAAAPTATPEAALLDRLRAVVGARHVVTDAAELAPRLAEGRGRFRGRAVAEVRPASVAEVAACVRLCAEAGAPVTPQGGNTGLVGGGVPDGGVILTTGRLNRIREIDPLNATMTVEAGCVLARIQAEADRIGRLFPLSLASEGSCQIGGNLAANAGGTAVLRYGNARELTLGLEVVLPDGQILSDLNTLRKNNTGYDLRNLFIGAEGTLGIITAAVIKLFPKPVARATAFVGCADTGAALALFDRLRARCGDSLSAFEYMERLGLEMSLGHLQGAADPLSAPHPCYALIELTTADPQADPGAALEVALAGALEAGEAQDAAIGASEAQKAWGASIKHDVSVPVSRVADFIAEASRACRDFMPGVRPCPFGHFGDGNIHFNLTRPEAMTDAAFLDAYPAFNRIVHDIVHAMRGAISAEHGIGLAKRAELTRYRDPVALALMRRLKAALDPAGVMNPGKIL